MKRHFASSTQTLCGLPLGTPMITNIPYQVTCKNCTRIMSEKRIVVSQRVE